MNVKNYFLIGFLFLQLQPLFAQSLTKAGWDAFALNDKVKCTANFGEAIKKKEPFAHISEIFSSYYCSNRMDHIDQFTAFKNTKEYNEGYEYALWSSILLNLYNVESIDDKKLSFLKKVVESNEYGGTMKAVSRYSLGKYYTYKRKWKDAAEQYKKIGAIDRWQITGTFDNVQGSGFNKQHGPLEYPGADAKFINKNGAEISWRTPQHFKPDGWIDYVYLSNTIENSIFYAQTFIDSPEDREVILSVGVSGSLKIWLNDQLVGTESEERNTDLDVYSYKTKLQKGTNRIVIQTGSSSINSNNFLLRITNDDFTPYGDLSVSAAYKPYTKAANLTSVFLPLKYESFFEQKLASNPSDILHGLLLIETYLHNDKIKEAKKVGLALQAIYPDCSLINLYMVSILSRDQNEEESSLVMNNIVDKDSSFFISLGHKYNEEIGKENYIMAKTYLDKIEKISSDRLTILSYKIQLAALMSDYEKLYALVLEGYDDFPSKYEFVNLKYLLLKESKDIPGANAILEKFVTTHNNDAGLETLFRIYTENNKIKDASKLYEDLFANQPFAVGYLHKLSDVYFNARDYAKAAELKSKELEIIPYSANDWQKMGDIYEQLKKNDLAINYYNKALYYSPNNYKVRNKIRTLKGEKEIYTYFPNIDPYSMCKKAPTAEDLPGESMAILNYEVQRVIYPEGGDEEKNNILIKILNDQGVESWKEYNVSYNDNDQSAEIEKAEIIKPNGSRINADINGDQVIFSGLQASDCIHIIYKYQNFRKGKLLNHFWGKFQMEYFVPTQQLKYHLLIPKGKEFKYEMNNGSTKPSVKSVDNFDLYTWQKSDVPKIVEESLMPASPDYAEILHFSSIPDWNYVAEWYRDLAYQSDFKEPAVTSALSDAFKDRDTKTPQSKLKAIYEYIVKNIKYSSVPFRQGPYIPQAPARTLSAKLGDCKDVSTLFVAMAKEAGLEAGLVLVNTRDHGKKDMILPSIEFNHCIAKTNINNKDTYLELTWKSLPFANLEYSLRDAQILDIPDKNSNVKTANLINLTYNAGKNSTFRTTKIAINGTELKVQKQTIATGNFAGQYRDYYHEISKEELDKKTREKISNYYTSSVKIENVSFKNLENLSDSLILNESYAVSNGVTKVGNLKIIPLNWTDKEPNLNFMTEDVRKTNMDYYSKNMSDFDEEEIIIQTSNGEKFIEVPENVNINFDNKFFYTVGYKVENNTLKAKRTVKVTDWTITPDRYPDFKTFFSKIVDEDNKQIGFK